MTTSSSSTRAFGTRFRGLPQLTTAVLKYPYPLKVYRQRDQLVPILICLHRSKVLHPSQTTSRKWPNSLRIDRRVVALWHCSHHQSSWDIQTIRLPIITRPKWSIGCWRMQRLPPTCDRSMRFASPNCSKRKPRITICRSIAAVHPLRTTTCPQIAGL